MEPNRRSRTPKGAERGPTEVGRARDRPLGRWLGRENPSFAVAFHGVGLRARLLVTRPIPTIRQRCAAGLRAPYAPPSGGEHRPSPAERGIHDPWHRFLTRELSPTVRAL